MELFATRGYFLCRYCGTFHFPESANDQGVRVLADAPGPLPCPACSKGLATAMLDETHPVHYCRNCRGVLMSRGSFGDVVRLRRAWASGPPADPVPLRQDELKRAVGCPICHKPLATYPYFGPGNVVIDTCEACNVVWLDFGELKQIVDAPGQDRGGRERSAAAVDRWNPAEAPSHGGVPASTDDAGRRGRSPDILRFLDDLLFS
jgi:Zn-finger nucleic acid-binding protein